MKIRIALYARAFFAMLHIFFVKILNSNGFSSALPQDISCGTKIRLIRNGKIRLEKHIHTRKSVEIIADGGDIRIGKGSYFNSGCMITAKGSITIGEYTSFGPNTLVYDHDHRIDAAIPHHDSGFEVSSVIIGSNVWIGANTVILRGTVLSDGCVVGAGSVLKGEYPPNTVIIQKREETIRNKSDSREEVYTA